MSYQEKRTITSIVTGACRLGGLLHLCLRQYQSGAGRPGRSEILGKHHADLHRHRRRRIHRHSDRFSHPAFDRHGREEKDPG